MKDDIVNAERLISNRAESPSPSLDFEERLLAALERKQRELGRVPAGPSPRGRRIPLVALTGLAAACVFAIHAGEYQVGESPAPAAPAVPSKIQAIAEKPVGGPKLPGLRSVPSTGPVHVAQLDSGAEPSPAPRVDEIVTASEPLRRTLGDGSVVFLDTGARAVLGARTVKLLAGRGFVEVAPTRPGMSDFTVVTDSAKAVAHGTKFAFDLTAAGLGVAVAQGTVELANERGIALVRAGEVGRSTLDAVPAFESAKRLSFLCSWMDEVYGRNAAKRSRSSAGRLVALDPYGQEFQLSVRNVHVDVHIEDGIARTTIDTTYFNETYQRIEGTFSFLLPPGASVSRLAMYVNGRLMEGGVLERTEARQVYEQIRYQRTRDPALLEWMEGNAYKMRIFPLEPRQEKRVLVSFTQELEPLYGALRYALPLEVQGREIYERFSMKVRVKDALRAGEPDVECSWPNEATRDGEDLVLTHQEGPSRPKRDLVVKLDDARAPRAAALADPDARYVLARVTPSVPPVKRSREPRHFVLVVEKNGARKQADLIAQNELVGRLLAELDDDDRFQLVALSTRVQRMEGGWRPVRGSSDAALAFLDSTTPLGATDVGLGLSEAAKLLEGTTSPHVVYIGSGVASFGETDPNRLVDRLGAKVTFVGLGVGRNADESLLASLSSRTGGTYALVSPDEAVSWRVFDLVAALATPRLTGVNAIALDARGSVVPGEVFCSRQTVADGEEVRVLGRFSPTSRPAKVVVSAFQNGEPVTRTIALDDAKEGALYLPRLWARRHVEALIRDGAAAHRPEILALGKRFFLATPVTSLIVLENEAMYREFKVEPSPLDRFAPYETPKTIPVVSEWGYRQGPAALTDEAKLLDSIMGPVFVDYPPAELGLRPAEPVNGYFHPKARVGYGGDGTPDGRIFLGQPRAELKREIDVTEDPGVDYDEAIDLEKRRAVGDLTRAIAMDPSNETLRRRGFVSAGRISAGEWRARGLARIRLDDRFDRGDPGIKWHADRAGRRASGWYGSYGYNTMNLVPLAPGLNPRSWDTSALLERELDRKPRSTKQDPQALALLAKARVAFGTRSVQWNGFTGFVAGDGRVCLRHRLGTGLEEVILATEDSLYEAYPELGLASVRTRSRFADGWLEGLLPFLPPSERALAGWAVSLRGTSGVTLEAEDLKVELDLSERGLVTRKRVFVGGLLVSDVSVEAEVRLSEPTAAASFAPHLDGYVLVEMPARTAARRQAQLNSLAPEKGAERLFLMDQLAFTNCLTFQWVSHAKDTRRGIQVLRLAANQLSKDGIDEVVKTEPELGAYARAHFETVNVERTKAFSLLAKELVSGFFASMARFGAAQNEVRCAYEKKSASQRAAAIELVKRYVDDRPQSPLVASLAEFVSVYGISHTFTVEEITRIFDAIPSSNGDAAWARLACAHFLQANGKSEDAARHFEAGYWLAMEKGEFPTFTQVLPAALGDKRFKAFLERALEWASARPFALVRIVASAVDAETALRAIKLLPEPMPAVLVRELAVHPYVHNATTNDRLQILEALLARPSLAKEKWLHASAGHLAHQQGLAGAAARHYEAALGLETGVANLAELRQTIANLFQDYSTIAAATHVPGQSSHPLLERVHASLDVARRLDTEDASVYAAAAKVFQLCGEPALVLEAVTTPIALEPAEGASHSGAAATLSQLGDHALAATLYARAAVLEPQDPTPLFNEASERVVLGEPEAAKALYKKIATGKWHERFRSVVATATQRQ